MADPDYDAIVIGAGAGGMTAAAVAAAEGLSVLLVEKTDQLGGTTAVSGGMIWIPANGRMGSVDREDTRAAAETYLGHVVPGGLEGTLLPVYLERAPEAIDYLEARTAVRFRPLALYPDYYPDLPGATLGGRVMEPVPFDARELGPHFDALRWPLPEFTLFGGMMVDRADIPHFRKASRSWRSALRVARVVARYARDRLRFARGAHLVLGNALAARLLLSVTRGGVRIERSFAVDALVREGGRVTGIASGARIVRARRGVVLAAGGFSHDPGLRARYLPEKAGTLSAVCPANTGDGVRLGLDAGARVGVGATNNAPWAPHSPLTREDSSRGVYPRTVTDRAKPGVIAVDRHGRRFTNEARSYHEFVQAMFRADAIPAWLVCDRVFLWKYGLGAVKPFTRALGPFLREGYLRTAPRLAELAGAIGVDAAELERTIAGFDEDARAGVDRVFGKGGDAYQRYLGDAEVTPNPCLAPIEHAPFYAVAVYPGDLGTAAGLVTDAHARVLDARGEPIAGLYACGNDMRSVMNGAYPGPGITLGPALTFGYIAARHLARPAGS